jgi:glucose dehydrogenase
LVDEKILNNTNNDSRSWLTHGLNYNENRFSQLTKINQNNVKDLALSWSYDLDQMKGVEATPIIANGVMYVTGSSWSMVYALDAITGKKIWQYDPEVPSATLEKACCDAVNRGVAIFEDKIYFGSLDGRLIALNAKTGKKVWEVNTVDKSKPKLRIFAQRRYSKFKCFCIGRCISKTGYAQF